ncbi:MAG TPA: hypothetical protein PKM54_17920 [Anaerolineales bacterium]|nr:hypothetical protein [Anaerolineales bacterium]
MTAKTSGARKLKRRSLPKFDPSVYSAISSVNLVAYAIHFLLERGIEIHMEDVVFGCFLLFPHKFALKKYPRWPDSAVVGRRVGDCRSKGYIAANTEFGFKLTVKGTLAAERAAKALGIFKVQKPGLPQKPAEKVIAQQAVQLTLLETKAVVAPVVVSEPVKKKEAAVVAPVATSKPVKKKEEKAVVPVVSEPVKKKEVAVVTPVVLKPAKKKEEKAVVPVVSEPVKKKEEKAVVPVVVSQAVSREEKARAAKFVRAMEVSDAYRLYKKNGKESKISEFDFRSLLLCTMESSSETLARNVELYKGYASIHNRQDLLTFLGYCETTFETLLKPGPVKKAAKKK